MLPLWLRKSLLRLSRYLARLSGLQEHRDTVGKGREVPIYGGVDSSVEIEHGRRDPRGDIDQTVERFWDRAENPRGMEGILQSAPREEEAERIQRKAEQGRLRATQLTELSRRPGYNILVGYLKKIESDAYYNLRLPDKIHEQPFSLEYALGRERGRLEVVEDIRVLFADAKLRIESMKRERTQTEGQDE